MYLHGFLALAKEFVRAPKYIRFMHQCVIVSMYQSKIFITNYNYYTMCIFRYIYDLIIWSISKILQVGWRNIARAKFYG